MIHQSFADWCVTPGLDDAAIEMQFRAARDVGYEAVEMAPPSRWAMAKRIGLKLLNIAGPGMQSGLNRRENHGTLIPAIGELIDTAAANQIEQIIVFTGNRDGQCDAVGIAAAVEALQALAAHAESAGITLMLELLSQAVHPDYQADQVAIGAAIVRRVNSPAVKLLYDIYHMHAMGADVEKEIVAHLDCIGHLHIAAANRGEPVENDAIHYLELVPQILSAGYRGWWGQEFLTTDPQLELARALQLFDRLDQRCHG